LKADSSHATGFVLRQWASELLWINPPGLKVARHTEIQRKKRALRCRRRTKRPESREPGSGEIHGKMINLARCPNLSHPVTSLPHRARWSIRVSWSTRLITAKSKFESLWEGSTSNLTY
jgi:hypothetical protein